MLQNIIKTHYGEKYTLFEGENSSFLPTISDNSIKLIITSPPYNVGKEYETKISLDDYIDQQKSVISECVRTMKTDGSICWQIGNTIKNGEVFPLDILLYPLFKEHNLKLRNRIVWHYEHGLHCNKRLSNRHETILWFTFDDYDFNLDPIRVPQKYPGKKYFKGPNAGQISSNPLGKNPGDVWIFPNVKGSHPEKTDHPAQFPVELCERLILSLSNPGDIILDPYIGSGTTAIAAIKNGRFGVGGDKEEKYIKIALERISQLENGTLKTRSMDKPVKLYAGHGAVIE